MSFMGIQTDQAQAATSNQLNFQGRLLSSSGNLVPDGDYNIEFKLYNQLTSTGSSQGSCAGDTNCLWTETRPTVRVQNGYFSVYLGDTTALPTGIDWSQDLFLGMNVGGIGAASWDGEMSPRFKLTAVPYAFRASNVASSATNAASTNSDAVSITSGNALGTTSNSGNISIDTGTATGTTGTISLGSANASSLLLGRAGLVTAVQGGLSVAEDTTLAGNLAVNGGNLTTTAATLNLFNDTAVATVNAFQGAENINIGGSTITTVVDIYGSTIRLAGLSTGTAFLGTSGNNFAGTRGIRIGTGNTGASSGSGTTGTITIETGNANPGTNGSTGNITIDTGSISGGGTGTAGVLNIGALNASALTIGNSNAALTVNSNTTFNGNLVVSAGTQFTNAGSTLLTALVITDRATGGNIGTAATTVDVATTFNVNQTTASQTLTLPAPTDTTSGRIVYVNNVGSAEFTMYGSPVSAGSSASFIWNGTSWVQTISFSSTGVEIIGALDAGTANANGATITGTTIYLQSASASFAGLVNTSAQTFAGAKTFNDSVNISASSSSTLTGTADPAASVTLPGTGTAFLSELQVGDRITINAETRTVTAIATNTSLTVDTAFTDTAAATVTRLPATLIVKDSSNNTQLIVKDNGDVAIDGNTLFVDATNNRVGIGTSTPEFNLNVSTTGSSFISNDSYGGIPVFQGRKANGTPGSESAVLSSQVLAQFSGGGYGATGWSVNKGALLFAATENWTDTAQGTNATLYTTENGTTTARARLIVGDKGDLTINASKTTAGSDAIFVGTNATTSLTAGSVDYFGGYRGSAVLGSSGTVTAQFYGLKGDASIASTATNAPAVPVVGLWGEASNNSTLTVARMYAIQAQVLNYSTGSITDSVGIRVKSAVSLGGSIANNYGLYIENQSVGTADYGVYVAGADTYALFVDSGATRLDGTLEVQGLATLTSGLTVTGAAINLNASSNFNTNINTGTSTGTVAIGNSASTTDILGATNINTSGTATTTIGNAGAVVTAVGSTINLNSGTIVGNATTQNLFNTVATTLNLGGESTSVNIGATTGTLTVRNANQTFGNAAGSGVFTNNGATVNTTLALTNFAAGGSIGSAATTVDIYTAISVNQTTAAQTLTIPAPTANTIYGRTVLLSNIGTAGFTVNGTTINPGTSTTIVWSNTNGGASWQLAGSGGSGVSSVGAISGSSNANGATITGTTLNLTAADGTNGGVVTNTTQTFAGDKTFSGAVTAQGLLTGSLGATISGGTISLNVAGTSNTAIGNATGTLAVTSSAFNLTTAGAVSGVTTLNASGLITGLGYTAGAGLIQGTGGLTITGTTLINTTGTAATTIGNSTGTLALLGGNSTSLVVGSGANTTTLNFTAPSGNNTITFPAASGTVQLAPTSGSFIRQIPTTTAENTITPTAASVVGLTVNATSNATGATGLVVNQSNATQSGQIINQTNTTGTQANGLLINRNTAGGTTTSLLGLTNTAGTATNGILFTGTIGTDITTATNRALTIDSNGTGGITIGGGTGAKTVNLGTGATGIKSINIGGTAANVIRIGDTQTAGSISLGAALTTGTINIGGTGAQTGAINLGNGTGTQTINLAAGAGVKTTTLGSITGTSTTNVRSGTGGISLQGNTTISGANTFTSGTGAVTLNGATSITGTNTLTVGTGLTSLGGALTVTGLTTLNGGLTVETGDTFTFNGDGFTDFTGGGLFNDSGVLSVDTTSATGFFRNGGNSFGATAVLGTNDANSLVLETNNQSALTVANGGAATFQNASNSTSALSVLNAAGTTLLNVDTTNSVVRVNEGDFRVGNGAGSSLLTLDSDLSTNSARIDFGFGGGNGRIDYGTTGDFNFFTGGVNRLTLNSTALTTSSGVGLTVNGAGLFQNDSNSVSAFAINNAAGSSLFEADTTNGRVGINTTPSITGSDLEISRLTGNDVEVFFKPASGGQTVLYLNGGDGNNNLNIIADDTNESLTLTANGSTIATNFAGSVFNRDLTVNGAGLFQNDSNSVSAFAVNNAAGSSLLEADTTNYLLKVAPTQFLSSGTTQDFAVSGSLTGVDSFSTIAVNATAPATIVTLPAPAVGGQVIGRVIYVTAVNGSNDFTLRLGGTAIDIGMKANSTATLIWNGTGWTAAGASSSTDLQSAYANTLSSAGGAEILLNPAGGAADGLTIRNNNVTPINGGILEIQSAIGTNLFSVNNIATEFAANGGAENSVSFGSDWESVGTVTLTRNTTPADTATGTGSVSVVTNATNEGVRNNLTTNLTPSTQYLVSFTAKTASGTLDNADLDVYYSRNGGGAVAACDNRSIEDIVATGFTKFTCTITTDGTGASNPDLIIRQTDGSNFTIFIDNLSVTENSANSEPDNVQIGGGINGGPVTLFTLDRASAPPVANGNQTFLGSMYYDTTSGRIQCYESDGWGACGSAPNNYVNLTPEYPGSVLNGTGVGTMTADFCANDADLSVNSTFCAAGEALNYYNWTSPQATEQEYSIYVTYQLPAAFKSFDSNNTVLLTGRVSSTSLAEVSYEMFRRTTVGTDDIIPCGTETTINASANVWETTPINGDEATACGFDTSSADEFVVFKINLKASQNANAYVSTLSFTSIGQ